MGDISLIRIDRDIYTFEITSGCIKEELDTYFIGAMKRNRPAIFDHHLDFQICVEEIPSSDYLLSVKLISNVDKSDLTVGHKYNVHIAFKNYIRKNTLIIESWLIAYNKIAVK